MSSVQTVTILKSLADDIRLSIVRKLAEDTPEVSCGDIVRSCASFHDLSQPTMSHHFTKLVQAGVLIERKVGTEKLYQINEKLLASVGVDPRKL